MVIKLNKKQNKFVKELFTKNINLKKLNLKNVKVVLRELNKPKYELQFSVLS